MKHPLFWQVFTSAALISLIGAGCLPAMPEKPAPAPEAVTTPMPERAALPTEAEVDKMSVEERDKAMQEFLQSSGPMPMDQAKKDEAMKMGEEMKAMAPERSGSFHEVVHAAGGSAKLVQKDGKWLVVLSDDFKTDAGPQLHVYVSGHADPRNSPDVHTEPSADLGRLASNAGTQAYELGAIDPQAVKSIVIYCKPFKVVFAVAALR